MRTASMKITWRQKLDKIKEMVVSAA